MKIKFRQPYLSINKFNDVELPDFTVLTGKNGTGKTHFLEGIAQDKFDVEIDSKIVKDSVYFSYVDFIVRQQSQDPKDNPALKKIQNSKTIQQDLQQIKDGLNNGFQPLRQRNEEQNSDLFNLIFNQLFTYNLEFLDNWPSLKEIKTFVKEKRPDGKHKQEEVKKIYDETVAELEKVKKTKRLKRYYNLAKEKNIHLMELQAGQLTYNESWLGQQLENQFKQYRLNEQDHDYNLIAKARKEGGDTFSLDQKSFEAKNGVPPWEVVNKILEEYSCNDYFIDESQIPRPPRNVVKPEDYKIEIWLKSKGTGQQVKLENLSSGEKTLFALVLSIYQQTRPGSLPEVLLLDEVDTSLHPSMTTQFLDAVQKVFVERYGMKVILVTHAPSTVALAPEESIYVMDKLTDDIILKTDREEAVKILSEGIMTFAEGIKILKAEKPYLHVEGDYDVDYLKKAAELGHDEKSVLSRVTLDALGGDQQLKTHFRSLQAVLDKITIPQAHIYLFDCDVDVQEQDENSILYKRKIQKLEANPIKKGVENLFPQGILEKALEANASFIIKTETTRTCGTDTQTVEHWELNQDQKRNLCDWICANGVKTDFVNFKAVFDKIDELLTNPNNGN